MSDSANNNCENNTHYDVHNAHEHPTSLQPHIIERRPIDRVHHGRHFIDNYEWIRNTEDPAVREYVNAEMAYGEQHLAPLKPLQQTLFAELKSHTEETGFSVPIRSRGYWYFSRINEGEQFARTCRIPVEDVDDWNPPTLTQEPFDNETILFDPNVEAREGCDFSLGVTALAYDDTTLLYSVDYSGDEQYEMHIRNVLTGEDFEDCITGVAAGGCITPDAHWVFYLKLDEAMRPAQVWRHEIGEPVDHDVCVWDETDERFWLDVSLTYDAKRIVIYASSKITSEVLQLDVKNPTGEFLPIICRTDGVDYVASMTTLEGAGDHGEDVPVAFVLHNVHNDNFEIDCIDMRIHEPPYTFDEGVCIVQGGVQGECYNNLQLPAIANIDIVDTTHCVFHEAENEIIEDQTNISDSSHHKHEIGRGLRIEGIDISKTQCVLSYRVDGTTHIATITKEQAVADFHAKVPWHFNAFELGKDKLFTIGTVSNGDYENPFVRYVVTSFTMPSQVRELNVVTGEDYLRKSINVLGDFVADRYEEHRLWVSARDGRRIPVSLIWRSDKFNYSESASRRDQRPCTLSAIDTPFTSPAPMMISGYGAYEYSIEPGFSVSRLSLLDRGILCVVVHVRGGGEMGHYWYEEGRLADKIHTFEDFVDATRALQSHGWATPERTVASGGSAGGLLMGAIANMAPDCYAGIEADVPFVDPLTTILNPALPLTVTEWDEWGNPLEDPEIYDAMAQYSPYENVMSRETLVKHFGVDHYPEIFIITSLTDPRVLATEPLKWMARLREPDVRADVFAKISDQGGHSGLSGRYRQWDELCWSYAWMCHVIGINE